MEKEFFANSASIPAHEEQKQRTHDTREMYFGDPRPESTEIRIDSRGNTSTNFLPIIKKSQELGRRGEPESITDRF